MSDKKIEHIDPREILKKYWGYDQFRPLQTEIIQSVIDGKDTLALLPTGGGKSICYQVPALVKDGICLVVSPLIALMTDQVEQLRKRGIKALMVHSGMSHESVDITLDNAIYGDYKFLYVSPERLKSHLFIERFKQMPISFVAIDEAHCISQWGHDFRPAYREISKLREYLPSISIIAVTATATLDVVKDIEAQLELKEIQKFQSSYTRKNLSYQVIQTENKLLALEKLLKDEAIIIYTRSRQLCQKLSTELNAMGYQAEYYHAGIPYDKRQGIQNDWIEGKFKIIVATNAFGMGIDKADVRQVIHMTAPDSIEAYVQEAGRAGRDGEPSTASLICAPGEPENLLNRLEKSIPDRALIKRVYLALGNLFNIPIGVGKDEIFKFKILELSERLRVKPLLLMEALEVLALNGYISLSNGVKLPSKVKFSQSGKDLYNFQMRFSYLDPIIKLILRSKTGVFDKETAVRESAIAKRLKISETQVEKQLHTLHKYEIITYTPKSELPFIRFELDRINENYIRLSEASYEKRYEQKRQQLAAMMNYLTAHACREQMILDYFGEKGKACGICDHCTSGEIETTCHEDPLSGIRSILSERPTTLEGLLHELDNLEATIIIREVRRLLDEGRIEYKTGMRLSWKKS